MDSPVDKLFADHKALLAFLAEKGELSHQTTAAAVFGKSLLLGIASFFESRIQEIVTAFIHAKTKGDAAVLAFAKKKGIERQYHTWFDWKTQSANSFFALFGQAFGEECKKLVRESAELQEGIVAFLDLGNTRNELVHLNFVTFVLEKTPDEVFALYKKALTFITWLEQRLPGEEKKTEPNAVGSAGM